MAQIPANRSVKPKARRSNRTGPPIERTLAMAKLIGAVAKLAGAIARLLFAVATLLWAVGYIG